MPYLYATALDWSFKGYGVSLIQKPHAGMEKHTSVAAQVQADTIPDAIRPGLMLRDALLNSSVFLGE
jgi:hypothetical protein